MRMNEITSALIRIMPYVSIDARPTARLKCSSSRTETSEINLIHTLKADHIHIVCVYVSHCLYYLFANIKQ